MTRAWLTVEAGSATPSRYEIVPGRAVMLGRHGSNTVVLKGKHVSRWHAVILLENGKWIIRNLGQPINGTYVNGQPVAQQRDLLNGHEIVIGDAHLRFKLAEWEESLEVPSTIESFVGSTPAQHESINLFLSILSTQTDAPTLIHRAVEIALEYTKATLVGFLSLDAEDPFTRVVAPENLPLNVQLSKYLTKLVQKNHRGFWLESSGAKKPLSDSLRSCTDAICVPLFANDQLLGALHVYQSSGVFNAEIFQYCEILAGHLANHLQIVRNRRRLEAEYSRLSERAAEADDIIGSSEPIWKLRYMISKAAPFHTTVLIRGESGVGKELVALALHRQSPLRDGPLVVVNCAAIASSLPEAELFGHTKGAFTGADRDRPGLFQQADDGTLFLDEIGELPLDCQAKMLRAIEGHGFRAVGATKEIRTNVRIIAATNRDLEKEANKKRFRHDLLYRLQVIQIPVPALRERPDDIPGLATFFLEKLGQKCRRTVKLSEAALRALQSYSWPGNVRQLRAVLERAVVMSDSKTLDIEDLALPLEGSSSRAATLKLEELEQWAIRRALVKTKGNVTQAAKLLGIVRDTMTAKMKRWGIKRQSV